MYKSFLLNFILKKHWIYYAFWHWWKRKRRSCLIYYKFWEHHLMLSFRKVGVKFVILRKNDVDQRRSRYSKPIDTEKLKTWYLLITSTASRLNAKRSKPDVQRMEVQRCRKDECASSSPDRKPKKSEDWSLEDQSPEVWGPKGRHTVSS